MSLKIKAESYVTERIYNNKVTYKGAFNCKLITPKTTTGLNDCECTQILNIVTKHDSRIYSENLDFSLSKYNNKWIIDESVTAVDNTDYITINKIVENKLSNIDKIESLKK